MTENTAVVEKINELLIRYGLRSITMDDIARELGISKKTLYVLFASKADLVQKVNQWFLQKQKHEMLHICSMNCNAIEEILKIYEFIVHSLKERHPSLIFDMQKYFSESWNDFLEYKNEFIFKSVCENLQKGIDEGLYRPDLNVPVIAKLYVSRIDTILDTRIFPPQQFPFGVVMHELFIYHIRGLVTPKGLKFFEENIKLSF
jgi:TetR/AcrR family transcriptional regulator, cholesterol catabolism regulator